MVKRSDRVMLIELNLGFKLVLDVGIIICMVVF